MKTTSPAGGSAGSEENAGGCCPASTNTGSFSGRNMQLERVWTEDDRVKSWDCVDEDGFKAPGPYGRKQAAQQGEMSC